MIPKPVPSTGELFPPQPITASIEEFDEATFGGVRSAAGSLALTLESHIEDVLRLIRPGEDPALILERFHAAIDAAYACGLQVEGQVPITSENTPLLPETVAYLAYVGVLFVRVVPVASRGAPDGAADAFTCFSAGYLAHIRRLCEEAAEQGGARLVWEPRAGRTFGLTRLPGFCEEVWGRVRVGADGEIAPCMYAQPGELALGDLDDGGVRHAWVSTNALDLRRAHLSWDYPAPCTTCPRTLGPDPEDASGFVDRYLAEVAGGADVTLPLEVLTPGPSARIGRPPALRLRRPDRPIAGWQLAVAAGGEPEALQVIDLEGGPEGERVVRIEFPDPFWAQMEPNVGYWWALFGRAADGSWAGMTVPRAIVRHEELPRLEGSTLRYPDDVGADEDERPLRAGGFLRAEYDVLVERVRDAVRGAVPEECVCLVATKGDERLLDLGNIEAWHFPRDEDGIYTGYNPPDGKWAVAELERLRREGAEYLVIPATSFWWREHYAELNHWLRREAAPVLEDRATCLIVALRPSNMPRA